MKNLGGIICGICLDYYVEPITALCSHSFCQYCLQEYFLQFYKCPICEISIRTEKLYPARSLNEFTQNFIQSEDPDSLDDYYLRKNFTKTWKQSKKLTLIHAGMKIDIRDENHIWHQGQIIRIISRVGEAHKYLKIRYLPALKINMSNISRQKEEDLKVISQRLAPYGFFTQRF